MRRFEEIQAELKSLLPDLRRRYPIKAMGVFGSYLRNEQRPDSDLDILVELGPGIGLLAYAALQTELSDKLGVRVDLVSKRALKPRIGKIILAEVRPI